MASRELVFALRRHDDVDRDCCGPFTRASKHKHPSAVTDRKRDDVDGGLPVYPHDDRSSPVTVTVYQGTGSTLKLV